MLLQKFTRSTVAVPSRLFSTVRPALSETPAPAKGLYQFFENGEALPKRITTGTISFDIFGLPDVYWF